MQIKSDGEAKNLLFITNPRAGTMRAAKYMVEILQLYSINGFLPTVMITNKRGDAREFAAKYSPYADITVVAGGDGTLNEVIAGVIESGSGCRIGYIPAGSTNDFATSVGLPKSIMAAAELTVKGSAKDYDIGSFNGRYFSYVASFGAFSSTSYSVPQNIKNILGHNAYILQGVRDVFNIKAIHARVIADEGTPNEHICEGDFFMGAACNSTMVGGVLKLNRFDIDMNDGLLEVLLIEKPKTIFEANDLAISMLDGSLKADCIKFFSAKNVKFEMEKGIHWTLDGEYEEGSRNIEINTIQSAVKLIV